MSPVTPSALAQARKFSPALFAVILLCFVLPFVTVACDSLGSPRQEITTMSGFEMVVGKTVSVAGAVGLNSQPAHIDGQPLIGIALLAIVVGLVTAFLRSHQGLLISAGAGVVAFVALLIGKFWFDSRLNTPSTFSSTAGSSSSSSIPNGMTIVSVYQLGYWLALLLSALAAGMFAYFFVTDSLRPNPTVNMGYTPGGLPGSTNPTYPAGSAPPQAPINLEARYPPGNEPPAGQ